MSASTTPVGAVARPGLVRSAGKLTLPQTEVNRLGAIVPPMRMRAFAAAVAAVLAVAVGAGSAGAAARAAHGPEDVARAWSKALNAGNDKGAAALFAHNALVVQPGLVIRLLTPKLAQLWNSGLPCGGSIVRVHTIGNTVTVTFKLVHRRGHACDGPGQLAAARFTVVKGKITRWEQVPPESSGPIA